LTFSKNGEIFPEAFPLPQYLQGQVRQSRCLSLGHIEQL
jgi:hypothetical protein